MTVSRYFAPEGSIPQKHLLKVGIACLLAHGLYLVLPIQYRPISLKINDTSCNLLQSSLIDL